MANAVVNTSDGTATGTQLLGTITVNANGVSPTGVQTYEDGRVDYPVATVNSEVSGRFDNERYYTGDTPD